MPHPRNTQITHDPDLLCFACGNSYDYIGESPHPGVCPACGMRAVSFAGEVEVVEHKSDGPAGKDGMIQVRAQDETDRSIRYLLVQDSIAGVAKLYLVGINGTRITPTNSVWGEHLVADSLRELITSSDGYDLQLHVTKSSHPFGGGP